MGGVRSIPKKKWIFFNFAKPLKCVSVYNVFILYDLRQCWKKGSSEGLGEGK